jgi:1-acyl-sn-glycerol-3-phosphate acyltransferase
MRALAFNVLFWAVSTLYVLLAAVLALLPVRQGVRWAVRLYVKRMVQLMRHVAGIRAEARGRERLPSGPFIIAAKHSSYGDGFIMMDQFDDLAFVTSSAFRSCRRC